MVTEVHPARYRVLPGVQAKAVERLLEAQKALAVVADQTAVLPAATIVPAIAGQAVPVAIAAVRVAAGQVAADHTVAEAAAAADVHPAVAAAEDNIFRLFSQNR